MAARFLRTHFARGAFAAAGTHSFLSLTDRWVVQCADEDPAVQTSSVRPRRRSAGHPAERLGQETGKGASSLPGAVSLAVRQARGSTATVVLHPEAAEDGRPKVPDTDPGKDPPEAFMDFLEMTPQSIVAAAAAALTPEGVTAADQLSPKRKRKAPTSYSPGAAPVHGAPRRSTSEQLEALPRPTFPCVVKQITELRLSADAAALVAKSLQKKQLQLNSTLGRGLANEVAKINLDTWPFATGPRTEFSQAADRHVRQRGGLVDLAVVDRFDTLGAPLLANLFLTNYLLNEQNAHVFDYRGDNGMRTLFQRLAGKAKLNPWGSPLSTASPKLNGDSVAVSKILAFEIDKAAVQAAVQGLSEEEAAAVRAAMRSALHPDGKGSGRDRCSLNLSSTGEGRVGAFLMHEPRVEKRSGRVVGHAEAVLELEHLSVYSAAAALRCYNDLSILHARDLSGLAFDKKVLNVMVECEAGGMATYMEALQEGFQYLSDTGHKISDQYKDQKPRPGWWGRRVGDAGGAQENSSRADGLSFSDAPMVLDHTQLDETAVARRCMTLRAVTTCREEHGTKGHKCEKCTHTGPSGAMVIHDCRRHPDFCKLVEMTADEAGQTTSEDIGHHFGYDSLEHSLRLTHTLLATSGIYITSDWIKVNDKCCSYSCPATAALLRQKKAGTGGGENWIRRQQD